jgi:hypothetical protein
MIKTVELRFAAGKVTRDVDLGCLATDEHFVETGRDEVTDEREGLGRFHGGCVVEEGV